MKQALIEYITPTLIGCITGIFIAHFFTLVSYFIRSIKGIVHLIYNKPFIQQLCYYNRKLRGKFNLNDIIKLEEKEKAKTITANELDVLIKVRGMLYKMPSIELGHSTLEILKNN